MLCIQNLTANLGGRPVLRGVDLAAKAGEITAICGANGAGKSTLLRAILGEIPSAGLLSLNGRDLRRQSAKALARQRAVLAQDTHVTFAFTVAEVVSMGPEAGDAAMEPAVVRQTLLAVGLQGQESRIFQTLSGGERQRAQLARALAQVWHPIGPDGPRWFFLDEPVASLDLGHQLQVMALVRRFALAGGGVAMVMHDLNLIAQVAQSIGFVIDGRLAALGTADQVITAARLGQAYDCTAALNTTPLTGPWFLPQCCSLNE
jgi:iron complex transport system ATP-binding protein